MISEGEYKAKPIGEPRFSWTKDRKERVSVALEITEDVPEKGAVLTWNGYFTERTRDRSLESLRHMGWNGVEIIEMRLDREVQITVRHEEFRGKIQPRIRWINQLGGIKPGRAMTTEEVRLLGARLKHSGPWLKDNAPVDEETPF